MQIKNHFCTENYVRLNLSRNERSILAQISCGILPIHVETGRFERLKIEERLCDHCTSNAIEDEYHFLFHCPLYHPERDLFYQTITMIYANFRQLSDANKLKTLFTFEPRKLGKYACKLWAKRQESLYNAK